VEVKELAPNINLEPPSEAYPLVERAPEPQPPTDRPPYSLSVVIPAYAEADSVHRVIDKIREMRPQAEIIVVDDGSPDETS